MKNKVYIAGSLFTEADKEQRLAEEIYLGHLDSTIEVYNPISAPFNDKGTKPTAKDIVLGDTHEINSSTHVLLNLDNQLDAGVFVELGQMLEKRVSGEYPKVYPVITDIRMKTAGDYAGEEVPWGINQYVIGALQIMMGDEYKIYTSSVCAINALVEDCNK